MRLIITLGILVIAAPILSANTNVKMCYDCHIVVQKPVTPVRPAATPVRAHR